MQSEIIGRDFYFRRVYAGKPGPVMYARVYDAELFVSAEAARGSSDKLPLADRYTVELSTAGAFMRERRT